MTNKGKISKRLPAAASVLAVLAAALALWKCAGGSYGHLRVRVVDAYTLAPLPGARVIIAGPDMSLISDEAGLAAFSGVPVHRDSAREQALHQPWGECTIIAALDDYRPTVLFNAHVYPNRVREGPSIYMFPEETDDAGIVTISESPEEDWTKALAEKYSE